VNLVILMAVVAALALCVCVARLVRGRQLSAGLMVDTEWLEEVSVQRYLPMLLLLSEDLQAPCAPAGLDPAYAARLRARRCRMVRQHLRLMRADFRRLCGALELVLLQAQEDRPDLASGLLQRQITFAYRMTKVEFRLILYRWGIGHVPLAGLLRIFGGVRMELDTLMAAVRSQPSVLAARC